MRKLLNTLYVTNEDAYLCLANENIVCKVDNQEVLKVPCLNIEAIVCFGYKGCSPALMGKCAENSIPITFISPHGRYLSSLRGATSGNVVLRIQQIDVFRERSLELSRNTVATKICNNISLLKRTLHDTPEYRNEGILSREIALMKETINKVSIACNEEELLGLEGYAATVYFGVFDRLIKNRNECFRFECRNKRPPLDAINAMLSFMYTIHTNEYKSALETVGLDSCIGFYHKIRSGRASLACDLVEETRSKIERFVLGLVNRSIMSESDFVTQVSGAVYLNDEGRSKILRKWEEKKRTDIRHSVINKKIPMGLLPYVQANLLAKFIRGEIEEYPTFLQKEG